jgi:cytochrome c oxidase subunit 1
MGMPRRYYSYPDRFQWLHVLSTGGAFLLAGAIVLALANLLLSLRWGPRVGPNPWGSRGFEWLTSSPPPKHNFPVPPHIDFSPYDYTLSEEDAHARAFTR